MSKKKDKAYTDWWLGVREWVTLLAKGEREALGAVIAECDKALKKVAKRGKGKK